MEDALEAGPGWLVLVEWLDPPGGGVTRPSMPVNRPAAWAGKPPVTGEYDPPQSRRGQTAPAREVEEFNAPVSQAAIVRDKAEEESSDPDSRGGNRPGQGGGGIQQPWSSRWQPTGSRRWRGPKTRFRRGAPAQAKEVEASNVPEFPVGLAPARGWRNSTPRFRRRQSSGTRRRRNPATRIRRRKPPRTGGGGIQRPWSSRWQPTGSRRWRGVQRPGFAEAPPRPRRWRRPTTGFRRRQSSGIPRRHRPGQDGGGIQRPGFPGGNRPGFPGGNRPDSPAAPAPVRAAAACRVLARRKSSSRIPRQQSPGHRGRQSPLDRLGEQHRLRQHRTDRR